MDLSMPRTTESFPYRHKKFDAYKRPRDEDTEVEVIEPPHTPHYAFNPLFFGAERVSTPFSTDSNCSAEYAGFVSLFNAASTPSTKRQRLLAGAAQYSTTSPSEDSGISLTPQKVEKAQQLQRTLKRKLKYSALAEPLAKKPQLTPNTTVMSASSTNIIVDMALKRRKLERINKSNIAAVSELHKYNGIKAALKPALKPTPAGTLELATTTNASNPLPPPAATVLSRISEDKLRSICTYHSNMVRQFPKKERSPKDQERRNKNTIACRMSRRLKKLEHIAIEVQLKECERQYAQLMEDRLRLQTYIEQLAQFTSVLCKKELMQEEEAEIDVVSVQDDVRSSDMLGRAWKFQSNAGTHVQQQQPIAFGATPPSTAAALPIITGAYSIAYLMGTLRK
ncbi:uncharacterized protein [Eurosta solidaginis]|uniref:uncharacterized protein n=1 Tax=Eurosta solidaginis TaxID=178769 RepID=UPI0035310489